MMTTWAERKVKESASSRIIGGTATVAAIGAVCLLGVVGTSGPASAGSGAPVTGRGQLVSAAPLPAALIGGGYARPDVLVLLTRVPVRDRHRGQARFPPTVPPTVPPTGPPTGPG